MKLLLNDNQRPFFQIENNEKSIYYIKKFDRWFIGSNVGNTVRNAEAYSIALCLEEISTDDWYQWNSSTKQMEKPVNLQMKCLNDINCSCQKLRISGFQYQWSRNGDYIKQNSTLNGRKCFKI